MTTNPVLDEGCIEITLDGEVHQLIASPEALVKVSTLRGGIRPLYVAMNDRDAGAIIELLRLGLQWDGKKAQALPGLVFKTGVVELSLVLARYLMLLENGGRALAEDEGEQPDEAATAKKKPIKR